MLTSPLACDSWTGTKGRGEPILPSRAAIAEIDRKCVLTAVRDAIDIFGLDDLLGLTLQEVIDLYC